MVWVGKVIKGRPVPTPATQAGLSPVPAPLARGSSFPWAVWVSWETIAYHQGFAVGWPQSCKHEVSTAPSLCSREGTASLPCKPSGNQTAHANKAATEVGNRCQQCKMHPYCCVLDVADAGRAFLPQVQRIFQETQIKKAPSPGLR